MITKVEKFFKNLIEKNGLIKIIISYILLVVSIVLSIKTEGTVSDIFNIVSLISFGYLLLTTLVMLIFAIKNMIK